MKHKKAKSQENIKINPFEWGEMLTKNVGKKSKVHKNEHESIISKFAFCNRGGYAVDKKNKINQDNYIMIENFLSPGRYLFGVCDGHGVNGHYVSEFIR